MTSIEVFFLLLGSKKEACEEKPNMVRETQTVFSLLRRLRPLPMPAVPVSGKSIPKATLCSTAVGYNQSAHAQTRCT